MFTRNAFILLWSCLFWLPLQAQPETRPLFEEDALLEITLEANFSRLMGNFIADPDYQDATLTFTDAEGHLVSQDLEIKPRGRYRRDPAICAFPPLRFKFSKKDDLPAPFTGQRKLKLVTHCQEIEAVFREYYLYKVYNLLSPWSLRVRMAQITYVDSAGLRPTETQYGFFIESEKELAERMDGEPLGEEIPLTEEDVDRDLLTIVYVFNYMIANRDFGVRNRQNVEIVATPDGLPAVIPYDFDWSGMVDASYTKSEFTGGDGPTYYRRRRFKALCRSREEFDATFAHFQSVRDDIWELYKRSPYLSKKSIRTSLKYYKDFYKMIADEEVIQNVFVGSCNQ